MSASNSRRMRFSTKSKDSGYYTDSCSSLLSMGSEGPKRSSLTTTLTPNARPQNSDVLDGLTINKLKFSSLGLHGRDHEISVLNESLERLSSSAVERQLVLISGFSGTGKTALANTLKEPTRKLNGIYVQGKYELHTRNEPYVGIISASTQIGAHILSLKGQAVYDQICLCIKEEMGAELSLLIRFVPILSKLVGLSEEGSVSNKLISPTSEEAKNQIMFAFQRFVRIVSKAFAPLIFVLDDLQWADGPSLDLIDALVSDRKASKVMVIGIYRSNEVDQTHIFHRYLEDFRVKGKENTFQMTELLIGNLDLASVEKVVCELLSVETSKRAVQLAQVCYDKTQGNTLFLLHFLATLNSRNLLFYNLGLTEWTWNIKDIEANTNISDNVVDLLKNKMLGLSSNSILILKVAACLGSPFQEEHVKVVVEHLAGELLIEGDDKDIVNSGLSDLKQDGFIKETDASLLSLSRTFMWTHDKIHEAAASLKIDEKEWAAFAYQVGSILATELGPSELDSAIFVVAGLLNQSINSGQNTKRMDDDEALRTAALSYQASQKAVSLSAFESAAAHASFGINVLPENHWTNHYNLSLGLYSIGAQTEGFIGNQDVMEGYCNAVLSVPNTPLEDKLGVYHTLIDNNRNKGRPGKAAELILEILSQYGCHFPKSRAAVTLSLVRNVIRVKSSAKFQDVDGLCEMEDPIRIEMVRLIDKLFLCWYMSLDGRLPLATFRILDWTKRYGYCDYSSVAFAYTAMILTGVLDDIQGGAAFAKQALKLMEKSRTSVAHGRTLFAVHGQVTPWTLPFIQLQKPLLHAYDVGLRCGDAEVSTYAITCWLLHRFISGCSLGPLELDYQLYIKQMKDLGRQQQYQFSSFLRQVLLNLMGRNDSSLLELIGDASSEEELNFSKQDTFLAPGIPAYQGILQTYFGDHLRHADTAMKLGHNYLQKAYPCYILIPFDHCLKSVSCFVAASLTKKRKYVKMAEKLRSKIKRWRQLGNPNVSLFESLLDAESDRYRGETQGVIRHYEDAILFSGRAGIQHTAAYASERLGDFQLEVMGDSEEALYRIKQSMTYWNDYGAAAKVRDLQTKYRDLLLEGTG